MSWLCSVSLLVPGLREVGACKIGRGAWEGGFVLGGE